MPSARMGYEGELGTSYSSLPPYRIWSGRAQVFDHLEVTASYRVFNGILDPVLGAKGFGDFADKGANLKLALLKAEDSDFRLPGLAIGIDDFLGTRSFKSQYIVATQVVDRLNLEMTLGWGRERLRGFFGGVQWMPFRHRCNNFLRELILTAEYDAIPYHDENIEPHPGGRLSSSSINWGAKARLFDIFDLSIARIRGEQWAYSVAANYNFGTTPGFLTKYQDPEPYRSPQDFECIGELRPEEVFVQELFYPLRCQGILLKKAEVGVTACGEKMLVLDVINCKWFFEREFRRRLTCVIANLLPEDICHVVAVVRTEGIPIQEICLYGELLREYREGRMGEYEMELLTVRRDVTFKKFCEKSTLYNVRNPLFDWHLGPKIITFFGAAAGKFKFALGAQLNVSGFLPPFDVYYQAKLGYIAVSKLGNLGSVDILNPSQLPNVRTDIVNYYAERTLTFDELYLQKNFHLGGPFFSRASAGYFIQNWGGGAVEMLFYPNRSCFAVGIEAALLKKRTLTGLGFTNTIRQFEGFEPTYIPYTGLQYFLDVYYEIREWQLEMKGSFGQFLAKDLGFRYELVRTFSNGLRMGGWYTWTNGNDRVNGEIYYDKGVIISLPLDFFYPCSCKARWDYRMAAWLRDVGYRSPTGHSLYHLIRAERN